MILLPTIWSDLLWLEKNAILLTFAVYNDVMHNIFIDGLCGKANDALWLSDEVSERSVLQYFVN